MTKLPPTDLKNIVNNESFCILPWLHLHVWPDSRVFPCCMTPMDEHIGNLEESSLNDIFNNNSMKDMRLSMLKGEKINSCSRCYEIESHKGDLSLRKSSNRSLSNFLYLVNETNDDGSINDPKMRYWDIRFSNLCNFKCRSCGPDLSSSWYEDHNKMFNQNYSKVKYAGGTKEKLWQEIEKHIPYIYKIYFAGGEPMMLEEHYKILKILIENGKTDVEIQYNTNLSKLQLKEDNILDLWSRFENVYIGASLDGYGKIAEYIRKGTKWNAIEENIKNIQEKTPHVRLGINYTISALNALHFTDFIKYMINLGALTDNNLLLNYVLHPEELRVQILPEYMKDRIKEQYIKCIEYLNINYPDKFKSLKKELTDFISFMYEKNLINLKDNFFNKMFELDKIRNENLFDVLPEFKEFYDHRICLLPWIHTEIRPTGDLHPCCVFKDKSKFNIENTTIQEYSNGFLRDLRRKFLDGAYIPECGNCWREEDSNKVSKRMRSNKQFDISKYNLELDNFNLRYLDLKLGNTCNLKCVSCNSEYSSKWLSDELKLYGRIFGFRGKSWSEHYDLARIKNSLSNIEHIDFTGGEPFLISEHFKILEMLKELGIAKNISLHYNTNGTIKLDSYKINLLKEFKIIDIMFSIDCIEERFEYIRYPAKWHEVKDNFMLMLNSGFNVAICYTLSSLNIYYFNEFVDWFNTLGIPSYKLFVNFLHYPDHLSCKHIPDNIKQTIAENFKHIDYEYVLNFMFESRNEEKWKTFIDYITKLDSIRHTSFGHTFKDFNSLLKESI